MRLTHKMKNTPLTFPWKVFIFTYYNLCNKCSRNVRFTHVLVNVCFSKNRFTYVTEHTLNIQHSIHSCAYRALNVRLTHFTLLLGVPWINKSYEYRFLWMELKLHILGVKNSWLHTFLSTAQKIVISRALKSRTTYVWSLKLTSRKL